MSPVNAAEDITNDRTFRMEKFDGKDFNLYQIEVMEFMEDKGFAECMVKELEQLDRNGMTPPSDEQIAEWEKEEKKWKAATMWLRSTLTREVKRKVVLQKTAKGIWDTLLKCYAPRTMGSLNSVEKKFHNLSLSSNWNLDKVRNYIDAADDLIYQIRDKGGEISDKDARKQLIMGLPGEFHSWVYQENKETDKTYESTKDRLLDYAETKPDKTDEPDTKSSFINRKNEDKCFRCGDPDHWVRDCPEPETQREKDYKRRMQRRIDKEEGQQKQQTPRNNSGTVDVDLNAFTMQLIDKKGAFKAGDDHANKLRNNWIIDGGSTHHLTWDKESFEHYEEVEDVYLSSASGHKLKVDGKGTVMLDVIVEGKVFKKRFFDVFHASECPVKLLSETKATDKGMEVIKRGNKCTIAMDGKTIITGTKKYGLYILDQPIKKVTFNKDSKPWHKRLGHRNAKAINEMIKRKLVEGIDTKLIDDCEICESCALGKRPRDNSKRLTYSNHELMDVVLDLENRTMWMKKG